MNLCEFLGTQGSLFDDIKNISTNELFWDNNNDVNDRIGSHTITTTATSSENNGDRKIITTTFSIVFKNISNGGIEDSRYIERDPDPDQDTDQDTDVELDNDAIITKTTVTTLISQLTVKTITESVTFDSNGHEHKAEHLIEIQQQDSGELEITGIKPSKAS